MEHYLQSLLYYMFLCFYRFFLHFQLKEFLNSSLTYQLLFNGKKRIFLKILKKSVYGDVFQVL